MANYSWTSTDVYQTGVAGKFYVAGAAISAGSPVYIDSNGEVQDADADASATTAAVIGIAMNDAAVDQPVCIVTSGDIYYGAAVFTQGQMAYVSPDPGNLCPYADLGSGDYISLVGVASSATTLTLKIWASGVAFA